MNHNSVHDALGNGSFNRSSLQFSASNNLSQLFFEAAGRRPEPAVPA